jgi:hypothetical protein
MRCYDARPKRNAGHRSIVNGPRQSMPVAHVRVTHDHSEFVRSVRDARVIVDPSDRGTTLAPSLGMHALDVEEELLLAEERPIQERPTIPVPAPRESGVRLKVSRVPWTAATVDVVVCDLTRDPRSEDYNALRAQLRTRGRRRRPPFAR